MIYSPYLCTPFVQASVLLMVASEDEMNHADFQVTRQAFEQMTCGKQWYDISDGHWGAL